ncbi:MAG TPA: TusE/DsrC/DsvC family sulfur relay protein [Bacteroidales bacterium]|nr:TusE/DsrC/DsvC family sulfur relay protein [Bacteroidales bacterium]
MAEKVLAGTSVSVNAEGYFENPAQWNKEMATEMAREYNITLTDKHFAVLEFLRQRHLAGEQLTIRRVGNSGIVDIKELYQLFPGGPLKISSKLAGIPKPTSCV